VAGPRPPSLTDPTRPGTLAGLPRESRGHSPRPPRRARWQLTLGGILLLVVIAVVRGLHATPPPRPSHASPAAAVAGYLQGVGRGSRAEMRRYLAPPARPRLAGSVAAIERLRVVVAGVVVSGVDLGRRRAEVQLIATVCFHVSGGPPRCDLLSRHPLGLPPSLATVEQGGRWYVAEPIAPRA